jgi:cell division protein FtsI (penicillin-binding protein 3)
VGTGGSAAVPGYEVAGKTGTAQKARTDGYAGYAKDKYIASFSGYLPAGDPQVLIINSLVEPSNAIYGGTVAAPTFSKLAQFSVAHLKIPPSTTIEVGEIPRETVGAPGDGSVPAADEDDVGQ